MSHKYFKDRFRGSKCTSGFSFGTICLLACVILSSCSSSFDITKRRYNKGYYIDRSGSKDISLVTKEKATPVKITAPSYTPQTPEAENPTVSSPMLKPTKRGTAMVVKNEKQSHKKTPVTNTGQLINNLPANYTVQAVSAIPAPQSIAEEGDHRSERALSLFWLIIVIVLILWLIGLLTGGFGLGALINLLLIVALVLLILWLLRIV